MNDDTAYNKIIRFTNKVQVIDLGTYLDKAKYKWFDEVKGL
jgi:hypothetical protein